MPAALRHEPTGALLAREVYWARSVRTRVRGLIGVELIEGHALVIEPAAQIHTIAMRYPIDVIFCSRDWHVVRVVRSLRPYRVTRWHRGAARAIELRAGAVPEAVRPRDLLTLVE